MSIRQLSHISLAAALVGCGGHTLDVGSTEGGSGYGALGDDVGAGLPGSRVWNGTIENAQLSDGSNRLTMTLSMAPDGGATGTLLLGDGKLLQPATDPNVGYPPGEQFSIHGSLGYYEGFPYTIRDGQWNGSRLTFGLAEVELWRQWCSLQTPYLLAYREPDGGREYACAPNSGFGYSSDQMGCSVTDPSTMQDVPIDCGKLGLCENYTCECSATACRASSLIELGLTLDLTISGPTADGTISGELGDHAVHFVRAQ
jgi:hypothetical protein